MQRLIAIIVIITLVLPTGALAGEPTENSDSPLVQVGTNGSCYHASGCPRLRFERALRREDAQALGLEPCPVCLPDTQAVQDRPVTLAAKAPPVPGPLAGKPSTTAAKHADRFPPGVNPFGCARVSETRVCRLPVKAQRKKGKPMPCAVQAALGVVGAMLGLAAVSTIAMAQSKNY